MKRSLYQCCAILLLLVIILQISPTRANALRMPNYSYYNYDQYLKHVDSAPLPEDFIHYDQVKLLGEFYHAELDIGRSFTTYTFLDANKQKIFLTIYYSDATLRSAANHYLFSCSNPENMRKRETPESGSVFHRPLEYIYYDGKLKYIIWAVDELTFSLSAENGLHRYPTGQKDTIASRLLKPDKANDALTELMSDVPGKVKPYFDPIAAYLPAISLSAAVLGVITYYIIRKKRHNNN